MICISPMAPFCDRASNLPLLSTCITARIQVSGALKRLEASVTKAAKGSMDRPLTRCVADKARSACAAPLNSNDDAKVATMHTIAPKDRNAAFVLAAVQGDAPRSNNGSSTGRALGATSFSFASVRVLRCIELDVSEQRSRPIKLGFTKLNSS
jgi:hypothetical protein